MLTVKDSISDKGTEKDGVITWTFDALPVGEKQTVSFKVEVPKVTQLTNWINIGNVTYENNPDNPEDPDEPLTDIPSNEVEIEEPVFPTLTIEKQQARNDGEKTKDKLIVEAKDEVTYYLTIKNAGDEEAKGITITDAIPEGLTLVKDSISDNGTETDGKITWTLESLAPGKTKTVSFKIQVPEVTEKTNWINIGNVTYENNPDNPEDPDKPLTDIPSNEVEIQEEPKQTPKFPELTIEKAQSQNDGEATTEKLEVNAQDEVTYYLTIRNTGEEEAKGITITDAIPEGLTLVKDSISDNGTETDGKITWTLESLAPGKTKTVSFKIQVPEVTEKTNWINIGNVTYENNLDNPEDPDKPLTDIPSNKVEIEEDPKPVVLLPNVEIEKMQAVNGGAFTKNVLNVTSGDTVTYSMTVTNTGNDIANNVSITDKIPSGLLLVENSITDGGIEKDSVITWNIGNLKVGEKRTVSFKVTVPSLEVETDEVEEDLEPSENLDENVVNESSSEDVTVSGEENSEGVAVDDEEGPADVEVEAGTESSEDNTITDEKGNETEITDEKSSSEDETTIVPSEPDVEVFDDGAISYERMTWKLSDILTNTSNTNSDSPEKATRTWRNIASVSYTNNPEGPNPTPSNEVVITETQLPQLVIEKSQSLNTGVPTKATLEVNEKDQVTYHLTITNIGNAVAEGVTVTDEIPAGLSLVNGSISHGGTQINKVVAWNLGNLEAGESRTVSFTVTVPSVLTETSWINIAILSYINNPKGQDEEIPSNEVVITSLPKKPVEDEKPSEPDKPVEDEKPSEPTKPVEDDKPSVPNTGDETNLTLWLSLAGVSIVGLGTTTHVLIKKKKN